MSLAPPRPSPLAPGFRLDRYELLCPIAEGGMASVWIARQTGKHGFQKLVAVKTVLPKYAEEERFQQMFLDEARIASRIEHAHVAQILDVGEQNDVTYLVMEYVDGDALSKVYKAALKKGVPIPPGVALRVLADVCGGLHAAHELRDAAGQPLHVVHRDVSPQNVLVGAKGVAKLIDFGIAKARDRLADETNADQLKGKIHYMAPEQALGRPVDRRADVWAVGAVLYHLLAGKPPYEGENDIQTIFLLTSGRPPPPLPSGVHPAVDAIVKRALTHAPERRFATAAELQAAIEQAMIEAKIATTASAVAAFLEQHVGARAQKRREAIALGLKAAAEREKYAKMMKSHADADASGSLSNAGSRVGTVLASPMEAPSSSGSQATLGSAAITVAPPDRPHRARSMRASFAIATAGLALGVAGFVALMRAPTAAAAVAIAATEGGVAAAAFRSIDTPPAVLPPAAEVATAPEVATDPAPVSASAQTAPRIAAPVRRTIRRRPWAPAAPKPAAANASSRINDGF